MTFNEPSFNNKDEAKNFLRRLCGQEIIVHVSDGRRFIGSFWCTDNVGNIVMESNNLQRHFSTIVVPGQHITKVECASNLLVN
uniref:Hypotheticial protein n=1 Tax=Schistosoma japonicum TaxID=6182 RepID=C1LHB7_SCHJA|nr:hypotheticial protein [Schistosoma japonicum]